MAASESKGQLTRSAAIDLAEDLKKFLPDLPSFGERLAALHADPGMAGVFTEGGKVGERQWPGMRARAATGEYVRSFILDRESREAEMFREIIGGYLGGEPAMTMALAHPAKTIKEILEVNLADEKEAVDTYNKILDKVRANKDELKYEYLQIEHTLRHVIQDEQEHISELKTLMDI